MTLRWRLTALISLLLAAVLSVGLGGLQRWAIQQSIRRTQEVLDAAGARILVGVRDKIPLRELIREEPQPLSIAVYEGDSLVELVGHEPPADGENWQIQRLTVHDRKVVLGFPIYQSKEALRRQAYFLAWIGGLVWGVLSLTTYWVVGQTLRPIQDLADQADRAARRPGPAQLEAPSQDGELVHLVATLNGLLGQLHQRSARREGFHVAVSHELRTPLQALLGHIELALLRPRTPEEYLNVLQECKTQTGRLTQLIEALLLLNRLDYAPMAAETVDLNECFSDGSLPAGTQIKFLQAELRLPASQPLLEVLLRNLLGNAHTHRKPDTEILVEVGPECLRIENQRSSQEPLDIEKLREPFFRACESTALGNGLGLALVSAVVERLGWELELQAPAGRFIALVRYPIWARNP
jgi:two-component system heavy metal sensor histidine kinase CusS